MGNTNDVQSVEDEHIEPLFYPSRKLAMSAPFGWLRAGWNDFKNAWKVSLIYGGSLVLLTYLLFWLGWGEGNTLILFSLVVGLILMGPLLAFGLYSISRQLQMGLKPQLGYCFKEGREHMRNEMLFALVMLVVLLVWARAASMVHVFFPITDETGLLEWLQFLAVGSAVGSIFAAIIFMASAFALPMMLDTQKDAITSALTSVAAVLNNKGAMLVWALLIVFLMLLGTATGFIALALILPLIGHATWHAYRETIVMEDAE